MKLTEAYPSKYLSAEDLPGDVTVTITDVSLETIGQGQDKDTKLVLSFSGKKKQLVLNKTNARTIEQVLGSDETDDWIGQRIIIGPREVEFQGRMVMSIRVSLKKPGAVVPTPAPAPVEPADQDGANEEDF